MRLSAKKNSIFVKNHGLLAAGISIMVRSSFFWQSVKCVLIGHGSPSVQNTAFCLAGTFDIFDADMNL
jgi:hypothetical protein